MLFSYSNTKNTTLLLVAKQESLTALAWGSSQ